MLGPPPACVGGGCRTDTSERAGTTAHTACQPVATRDRGRALLATATGGASHRRCVMRLHPAGGRCVCRQVHGMVVGWRASDIAYRLPRYMRVMADTDGASSEHACLTASATARKGVRARKVGSTPTSACGGMQCQGTLHSVEGF